MCIYIYIYIYIHIHIYIYIYTMYCLSMKGSRSTKAKQDTVNPRTKNLDDRGFDSRRLLTLRMEFPGPQGTAQKSRLRDSQFADSWFADRPQAATSPATGLRVYGLAALREHLGADRRTGMTAFGGHEERLHPKKSDLINSISLNYSE